MGILIVVRPPFLVAQLLILAILTLQGDRLCAQIGKDDEGKEIAVIVIEGAGDDEAIRRQLKTKAGDALKGADVRDDIVALWERIKVRALVWVEDTDDGRVRLVFSVQEPMAYDRVEFRGVDHYDDGEVRSLLGMGVVQRVTDREAIQHKRMLMARYRRDGYYFVEIAIDKDNEEGLLTFVVDEGPKVTVRKVLFRGNASFPGSAPLGLWQNLVGSSGIESKPGALFSGAPYSEVAVEEDLDKIRGFYRRIGFRDAKAELARRSFAEGMEEVDLDFRIVEGRRYRISGLELRFVDERGETVAESLYGEERVLEEVRVKPGDFYDRDEVARDKRAIQRFYGVRGHPSTGRFGNTPIPRAFRMGDPRELFDVEKATIGITFEIFEGTPKKLRDVLVVGNTATKDHVIRRKVFLYPGDTIDTTVVEKSLRTLDALRYFQSMRDMTGARFELEPVEGSSEELDLRVRVKEGDTGALVWGAGVSSGLGMVGRLQFTKRNFDLFQLPSSLNPATVVGEIMENKAFHGAGQELEMFLAPGTEISMFRMDLSDPDLFGEHIDTIGGRIQGFEQMRILDSFNTDSLGLVLGMQRNFSEELQAGIFIRQETVDVDDLESDAPGLVKDAEGQTELRGMGFNFRWRDFDHFMRPTEGFEVKARGEVLGGSFGADESFWKIGLSYRYYHPLFVDSRDRAHVLHLRQNFDFGRAFGGSDDLFLTERYYMGGSNLRGFDQRQAGPVENGHPLGGEARFLTTLEYQFPLVSTRLESQLGETELLRGVIFMDTGQLGVGIDDSSFSDLRVSVGFGVRIIVPYFTFPIALDLGFPVMSEETDDRKVFYFTLGKF